MYIYMYILIYIYIYSVLMLASFEKTTDHLFDAAVHSRQDNIIGMYKHVYMCIDTYIFIYLCSFI
jgi:hypothetical protein